ncbi:MAG: hypothetical protein CMJ90_07930 [Planctomycetes bacterium]|nr:hypothetical protein [Planctomycetota bacterium]
MEGGTGEAESSLSGGSLVVNAMPYDVRHDFLLRPLPVEGDGKRLGPVLIQDKIGQGGMGIVYRGRHVELDRDVAIKCLFTSWAQQDPSYVHRFQREAKIAAELDHPNLVEVIASGFEHEIHYLIMELLTGITLGRTVRRGGPLDAVDAATIIHDAANAIAIAHTKEIVHRDVKPDNLLITEDGDVKLMDLGLAKAARGMDSFATASGLVLGSMPYMPPEQFRGLSRVGPPGDVYALGATLWFSLTGHHPPSAAPSDVRSERVPDVRSELPDTPEALALIIHRTTEPDAVRRFPHAGELAEALGGFLSGDQRTRTTRSIGERVAAQARAAEAAAAAMEEVWVEDIDEPPPLPPGAAPDPGS